MKKNKEDTPEKESKPPQNRQGRVLRMGIFFFVCAWMFVLGIFVGRGTAPVQFDIEKLQKDLAALKEAVIKEERFRFKIDSQAGKHKTNMSFYEKLKEPQDGAPIDSERQAEKPESKPEPKVKGPASESQPEEIKDKLDAAEPSRNDAAAAVSAEGGIEKRLTVQVASVKDTVVADRMVVQLRDKRYPAYKSMADIPGKGTWYRVRIGSFQNKADAQSTLDRLKKDQVTAILVKW